jgi:hypothetical protein
VLLVAGLGAAVLRMQPPREAERKAALMCVGMQYHEAQPLLGRVTLTWGSTQRNERGVLESHRVIDCEYPDRSGLRVYFDSESGQVARIYEIDEKGNLSSVAPLDRLRCNLARVLPILGE